MSLCSAIAVVLIWYGVWYFIDYLAAHFFVGYEALLALLSVLAGVAILYFPDKDLDELI